MAPNDPKCTFSNEENDLTTHILGPLSAPTEAKRLPAPPGVECGGEPCRTARQNKRAMVHQKIVNGLVKRTKIQETP